MKQQRRFRRYASARVLCGCALLAAIGVADADNSVRSLQVSRGHGGDGIYLAVTNLAGTPEPFLDNRVALATVNLPTGWVSVVPLHLAAQLSVGNQPRPSRAFTLSAQLPF